MNKYIHKEGVRNETEYPSGSRKTILIIEVYMHKMAYYIRDKGYQIYFNPNPFNRKLLVLKNLCNNRPFSIILHFKRVFSVIFLWSTEGKNNLSRHIVYVYAHNNSSSFICTTKFTFFLKNIKFIVNFSRSFFNLKGAVVFRHTSKTFGSMKENFFLTVR